MADSGSSGGGGDVRNVRTPLENGLQRELSIDKELQSRIFQELETLNSEASRINDLERGLHARRKEQLSLEKCLRTIKRKYESSLKKAQPFFKVLAEAKQKQRELREAAEKFERTSNQLADAKEKMALAEKGLQDTANDSKSPEIQVTDFAWLEILNNATMKVMEAEKEKRYFEKIHQDKAYELHVVVQEYNTTERRLRSTIKKVRPFLEERRRCAPRIQELKDQIIAGEQEVVQAKMKYRQAMNNLEQMNEEMHKQRQEQGHEQTDFFASLVATGMLYDSNVTRQSPSPTSEDYSGSVSDLGSICNESPTPSLLDENVEVIAQCVVETSVDAAVRKVSTNSSSPPPNAASMIVAISRNLVEIAIQGAVETVSQEINHTNR